MVMTNREALAALSEGKIVRSSDGVPIFHHPDKGFVHRVIVRGDIQWVQFGANLAADSYELALSVPAPVVET